MHTLAKFAKEYNMKFAKVLLRGRSKFLIYYLIDIRRSRQRKTTDFR